MRHWNRFFVQYQKDIKLLIFCFLFFQIYRAIFIAIFFIHVNEGSGYIDLFSTILQGAQYDLQVAAIWAVIPFLFLSIPSRFFNIKKISNKIRIWWGAIFTFLAISLSVASIEFYKEYTDIFNQFVFGIFYDDTSALMTTIIAEYNFGLNLFIVACMVFMYIRFFQKWIDKEFINLATLTKYLRKINKTRLVVYSSIILIAVILTVSCSQKAQDELEEIEEKIDSFLNKAIVPPFRAMYDAVTEFLHVKSQHGINIFLGEGRLKDQLQLFFNTNADYDSIDDYTKRITAGPMVKEKPEHIIYIVMESYDGWSLLPKYNNLNINSGFKELAKDGILLTNFLPASNSSMASLSAIVSGMPDTDIRTNYQKSADNPYPTSIALHFKKLGYKTRLFFSGYPDWHKVKTFFLNQGFDEVKTALDVKNYKLLNEWSVDDESLFNFVLDTLEEEDSSQPSFIFIMSGSNHAPYGMDLETEGFKPEIITDTYKMPAHTYTTTRILGHFWYADRELNKFTKKFINRYPKSLIAITGDHYGRHHIEPNANLYEKSIVPFLLYGPNILQNIKLPDETKAGCHLDIATSIIELIAPEGFEYHTMGNNLFAPFKPTIAIGNQKALTSDAVLSTNRFKKDLQYLGGKKLTKQEVESLKVYNNTAQAIAWWRIMKGDEINDD